MVSNAGGALTGGTAQIENGGTVNFYGATAEDTVFAGAGTLDLSQGDAGTISGFGVADKIDLAGVGYSSGDTVLWVAGNGTLEIENSGGTVLASVHLAGSYSQANFALTADSTGANPGTDVMFEPSLWGTVTNPENPASGEHLYGVFTQTPSGASAGGLIGALYGATASDYSSSGPDSINTYLLTLDPFLLPYASSIVDDKPPASKFRRRPYSRTIFRIIRGNSF